MTTTLPSVDKLIKDGLLMKGNDERLHIRRLATGIPSLDEILNGGFPYGRTTLMVGPESTGKTLIAQYAAKAQQEQEGRSHVLLVDTERSYDEVWWQASGVNTEELIISQPTTGEKAIDVMRSMIESDKELGLIILDSIASMTPMPILERSAEEKTMGLLAQLVNLLFYTIMPLNKQAIFIAINQLRSSMGGYGPEEVYPGGRGQRHYSHIILRTRREGWLLEGTQRVGFTLEVSCQKNKTGTPQGVASIPFRFQGQLDLLQSYIDEAINRGLIVARPPYYSWQSLKWLGRAAARQHFCDQPEAFELLKQELRHCGADKTEHQNLSS
jgi:recombination protein RecA